MDTKTLGNIIRNRRKEKNTTQEDIRLLCNFGNRFLSELERGKETAEIGLTLKILDMLNLDIIIVPSNLRTLPEYNKLKDAMNEYIER